MERRWVRPGHLYLVATPIGNQSDVTARALAVLAEVDVIAAEDTRVSGPWLRRQEIRTPMVSFHEHSPQDRQNALIERLKTGDAVALISDAGLPAVSDPGQKLVAAAWDQEIPVVPIPGASAGVTAFAVSGFALPMVLWGFLASRGSERQAQIAKLASLPGTHVIYEGPHRLARLLPELCRQGLGDCKMVIARELTKMHETIRRGTVAELTDAIKAETPRGEYTLVLEAKTPQPVQTDWGVLLEAVADAVSKGETDRRACQAVALQYGVSRRQLYQAWHQAR